MTSSFQDQMESAMAEIQQQRARLLQTRQDLEKLTVSASSKDHLVTVSAGGTGDVKEIKFNRNDYARMAPAELSAVLVETIAKAREQAAAKVQEAFGSLSGFGENLRDSLAGSKELDELFGEVKDPSAAAPATRFAADDEDDLDG